MKNKITLCASVITLFLGIASSKQKNKLWYKVPDGYTSKIPDIYNVNTVKIPEAKILQYAYQKEREIDTFVLWYDTGKGKMPFICGKMDCVLKSDQNIYLAFEDNDGRYFKIDDCKGDGIVDDISFGYKYPNILIHKEIRPKLFKLANVVLKKVTKKLAKKINLYDACPKGSINF